MSCLTSSYFCKKQLIMKLKHLFIISSTIFFNILNSQYREWEDLSVFSINTEDPHATFYPYSSEDNLLNLDLTKSELYKSLNREDNFSKRRFTSKNVFFK